VTKKILVTGGSGMIGSAIKSSPNIIKISSDYYDLRNQVDAYEVFRKHRPTHVIHLAARVGGVKSNIENMADFFRDNILINSSVLEAARMYRVNKVLSVLSSCIYPDGLPNPLSEKDLHLGEPHRSNYGYAYAKRMLEVQSRAYRDQYGCNFVTVIPNNLFGKNDNFDLENSHVIPAMIRKFHEAKLNNSNVTLWGDGSPLRQFTFSEDLANILMFMLGEYDNPAPINVGNSMEVSIKQVAEAVAKTVGFEGRILWDKTKPNGQARKCTNFNAFHELNAIDGFTDFDEALDVTYDWFKKTYPNVRGIK
jgi:GDP-L-fucose synthase